MTKDFYDKIRPTFGGSLKQSQVDGMETIFAHWRRREDTDLRWLAYMLATVFHETAQTMQPIAEYGKGRGRLYGKKIKHSGVRYTVPDHIYYGRGYVQLTWYENYELMGRLLGIDLLNNPDKAMEPHIASAIMFEGMLRGSSSFGDFTGKCLEQYFNDKTDDPINARRIINGLDKAKLIAVYHKSFLNALI